MKFIRLLPYFRYRYEGAFRSNSSLRRALAEGKGGRLLSTLVRAIEAALAGAEAFKRDNPTAEVHFYDTGHFALETHAREIANAIREFLGRKLTVQANVA